MRQPGSSSTSFTSATLRKVFSSLSRSGTVSLFWTSRAERTVTSFLAEPSRVTWNTSLAGGMSVKELGGRTAATFLKKVPTLSTDTGFTSLQPSTLTTSWCSCLSCVFWCRALPRLSKRKATVLPSATCTQVFSCSLASSCSLPRPGLLPSVATTLQWKTREQPVLLCRA